MSRNRQRKAPQQPLSQLRIIGGDWRGRRLQFAPVEGLRPTGDRLRETLFNWLQFRLPGARCLDLFAGSGALGLEALSRGAAVVDFVELNRRAADTLRAQLQLLDTDRGTVHHQGALDFLAGDRGPYDIAFLDPPFAADLWQPSLAALRQRLAPDARVYVETPRDTPLPLPECWRVEKEKRAGQVCMRLLTLA
ncbi:16S rRNA (guanine(966)-N(2))-methyltransferase RsmD [Microbulbifer sediminum]|uniref:16S rRNA (guanine(966)-N(2))-methyltransferase RsmD n=1 Tax=Microbulbifer sediminum TaxID=2904250 RepID=UPI001F009F90|nr:16S rRNA (guanine(966)-N(2))-methyltransferase RsmD [Microbulbifer sediminum]